MKLSLFTSASLFLFLACLTAPLQAQTTDHPGSVPVLLGLDSVRKELGLSKTQCDKLDKIRSNFRSDVRLVTSRPLLTPVEKQAANTTVKTLVSKYNQKAVAVLTPEQHARLIQIEHQMLGGWMLFLPGVQKQLGLSAAQIADLGKIHLAGDAFVCRINKSFEAGDLSLPDRLATLKKYRLKESRKALSVLTPAQEKKLQCLRGEKLKSM